MIFDLLSDFQFFISCSFHRGLLVDVENLVIDYIFFKKRLKKNVCSFSFSLAPFVMFYMRF
jgi:hypothetical protein